MVRAPLGHVSHLIRCLSPARHLHPVPRPKASAAVGARQSSITRCGTHISSRCCVTSSGSSSASHNPAVERITSTENTILNPACSRPRPPRHVRSQVASNVSDMKQPRLRRTQGPRRLCGKRLRAPATVTDRPRVRLLWRHMQDVVVLQTRKTHSRLAKKQSVRQSKPGEKNGKQKTHSGPDSDKEPFT